MILYVNTTYSILGTTNVWIGMVQRAKLHLWCFEPIKKNGSWFGVLHELWVREIDVCHKLCFDVVFSVYSLLSEAFVCTLYYSMVFTFMKCFQRHICCSFSFPQIFFPQNFFYFFLGQRGKMFRRPRSFAVWVVGLPLKHFFLTEVQPECRFKYVFLLHLRNNSLFWQFKV